MTKREMYKTHRHRGEAELFPTTGVLETVSRLLESNMVPTLGQTASQKQGTQGPETSACCLRSHPLTTHLSQVCPVLLKTTSVLRAGEGTSDGWDTVLVPLKLWCSEGNITRN